MAIGTGANAQRVGAAVLTWLHSRMDRGNHGQSLQVLFACDGTWIAPKVRWTIDPRDDRSAAAQEAHARALSPENPLEPIELLG